MKLEFIMLVGIPCSGKSTLVKSYSFLNPVVLSTDNYIDAKAKEENATYSEVFKKYIKEANKDLEVQLKKAIEEERHIIWDQTNVNADSRRSKLSKIPSTYRKTVVMIDCDLEIALARNKVRGELTGKNIPEEVVESFYSVMQEPTKAEGWDAVIMTVEESSI